MAAAPSLISDQDKSRQLVMSAEYTIGVKVFPSLCGGVRDTAPSVKLLGPNDMSLRLAVHSLTREAGLKTWNVGFYVEDLVDNGLPLEIDVTVSKVSTSATLFIGPTVTLTGNGLAGEVPYSTTQSVTVIIEVYSLIAPRTEILLQGLNAARVNGHCTDVMLVLGDVEFPAHRAVLAAVSPVFLKMFSGNFKEAKAVTKRASGDLMCKVAVPNVTKEAMALFLTLVYTGQAADWAGLEVELLEIADYYMVTHLNHASVGRLMRMNGPTALGILLNHADNPVISSELRVRAVQTVLRDWRELSDTSQWRNLLESNPVLADSIRAAQQLLHAATAAVEPEPKGHVACEASDSSN